MSRSVFDEAKGALKRAPNFDPAFRPAVSAGFLTVQQAVQRGNRQAFATRLASKYGIPLARALEVADNRVRLGEVVRLTERKREAAARARAARATARASSARRRRAARPVQAIVIAASLVGVATATWWGLGRWSAERETARQVAALAAATSAPSASAETSAADPARVARDAVDVEKNGMGMIARIAGPDPQAVLNAYCGAFPGLQPLGLAETVPAFTGSRLGIFRDLTEQDEQSILIRHDQRTGRWRAGDGTNPIEPRPVEWPVRTRTAR